MVSLEQLNNKYDVQELKSMIEEHVAATGSEKGKEILENFADYICRSSRRSCPTTIRRCSRLIVQDGGKGL